MLGAPTATTPPPGHSLLLYADPARRWSTVASWTRAGLARGEQVLLTSDEAHDPDPALEVLEERGVDVRAALDAGRLRLVPLAGIYPDGGQRTLVEDALEDGYAGLRVSGAPESSLNQMSQDEYDGVETEVDRLCAELPFSALCQYEAGATPDGLASAIAHHPTVLDDGAMVVSRVHGGGAAVTTELYGVLDDGNARMLREALVGAIGRDGAGALVLDLAGVAFLGLAGVRALLDATAEFRDAGGRVLLREVDDRLVRVLAMLGTHAFAGVVIEGEDR